jgi:hypothetical protein
VGVQSKILLHLSSAWGDEFSISLCLRFGYFEDIGF